MSDHPKPEGDSPWKYTFQFKDGRVPVRGEKNKVGWLSDKAECTQQAKSWGATHILTLSTEGRILRREAIKDLEKEGDSLTSS